MILVDHQIREAVSQGNLGIENFESACVQPASYDLRIGALVYSPSGPSPDRPVDLSANGGAHRIPPYGSALLMTYELLRLPPTMVGRIGLKSGFARRGLFASTGPQVDPGFEGKLFVSLLNLTPASHVIKYKDTFLSIEFHTLDQPPEKVYDGPYQRRTDITPDILEDLVRLEGLNLSQMQSQFSELTGHVREWSGLAARFDEFLREMNRHTKAIDALARRLSESMRAREEYAPLEARRVGLKQATEEALELFKQKKRLFYSDIAEKLRLDFATIIKACRELERRGLIEGDRNGKARAKKPRH